MPERRPLALDGSANISAMPAGDTMPLDTMPLVPRGIVAPPLDTWWNPMISGLGTAALVVNTMYLSPLFLPAMTLQTVQLEVTSATAGALLRLGFYGRGPDQTPNLGQVLADLGTRDASTVGAKLYPSTLSWAGGIIWAAVVVQGAACTIRSQPEGYGVAIPFANSTETPGTGSARSCHAVTGVSGALPTTGTTASNATQAPKLFFRRSAT